MTAYTTIAGSTIRSVANQFYADFLKYSAGYSYGAGSGDAGNDIRLYNFNLYSQDYNTTYSPVFECSIHLDDEILHLSGSSALKIQNRTLVADADAGTDEDNVTNNPLIGRSYMFKGMPKTRSKSAWPLNAVPINSGVQLVRAATMSTNTAMKEPPNPSIFSNCVKSGTLRLEPGAIKMSYIRYKKSMHFLEFLQKMNVQYGVTVFHAYHSIFPSEVFALEDIINVNGSQNISCAYEANQVIGMFLRTRKKALAVLDYTTSTVSNNP